MLYLQGKGRYQQEAKQLWAALVPQTGQADTVQGELVRAVGRLADESYRNGNINWDEGHRVFVSFLREHLAASDEFDAATRLRIEEDLAKVGRVGEGEDGYIFPDGEDIYDRITDRVVEWCRRHPDPIPRAHNPELRR
jgi:hypothetical protein